MNGSQHNTTRRAEITVATDAEPVVTQGEYSASGDGFTLRFKLGDDTFTIVHAPHATVVTATGVMAYEITLSDEDTQTLLATPFGKVRFDVKSVLRDVRVTEADVRLLLQYTLSSDVAGKLDRVVALTARLQ